MRRTRLQLNIGLFAVLFCGILFSRVKFAQAGGINGAESRVIAAAEGTFEYNGKMYVAGDSYKSQLRAKLAQDGVDLTEDQADEAISTIYANVSTGVKEGYIIEVSGQSSEKTNDNKDTKKDQDSSSDDSPDASPDAQESYSPDEEGATAQETNEEKNAGSPEAPETPEITEAPETLEGGDDASDGNSVETEVVSDVAEPGNLDFSMLWIILLAVAGVGIAGGGALLLRTKQKTARANRLLAEVPDGFMDIHCHILPGVDDGARNMDESMEMIDMEYQEGVRTIFLTPHFVSGHRNSTTEELHSIYEELNQKVKEKYGNEITLYLGNEIYYAEGVVRAIQKKEALTLADTRYVLVEFHTAVSFRELYKAVRELAESGYIPVVAHYERYQCLMGKEENVRSLKEVGAGLQMNIRSFVGNDRRSRFCRRMARRHLVHFVATDCHNTGGRRPEMRKGIQALLADGVTPHRVNRMVRQHGMKLLDNKLL